MTRWTFVGKVMSLLLQVRWQVSICPWLLESSSSPPPSALRPRALFTPTLCPETSGDPWEADAASRAYTPTIGRALPRLAVAVHSPGPTGRGLTAPLCPLGQPPAPPHRLKEVLFPSRSLLMFHWQTHKPCRPRGIKPSCAGTEKCHPLLKSPPKKKKKKPHG